MEKNKYLIYKDCISLYEFDNISDCFTTLKDLSDKNLGVVYTVVEEKISSSVFCTFVTEEKDS